MSTSSAVIYTFVSSEARSWSIPTEDPYEEAARCDNRGLSRLFPRLIEEFGFALHQGMSLRRQHGLLWCLRFVGNRTNVNARSSRSAKVDELKVCDIHVVCIHEVKGVARVAFKDKFRDVEEREVLCEAQPGDVRTLIMVEAHATKYFVLPRAEIEESKMIGLEMEQETTKVVVIKERLKEAKDRQERVKLKAGNQNFRI
nr:hypothetical protein [Tanacetum cinerariifolium]